MRGEPTTKGTRIIQEKKCDTWIRKVVENPLMFNPYKENEIYVKDRKEFG